MLPTKSKDLLLSSPMQQQRRISVQNFASPAGSQQNQTASRVGCHSLAGTHLINTLVPDVPRIKPAIKAGFKPPREAAKAGTHRPGMETSNLTPAKCAKGVLQFGEAESQLLRESSSFEVLIGIPEKTPNSSIPANQRNRQD